MREKGILLVGATAVISGVAIFVSKLGLKDFDPALFTWLRNTIVAVSLLGLIAGRKEFGVLRRLTARDWGRLAAIGLIGGSIPFLLFFQGLVLTSAANASFLHKTMFIWAALLAAPLLGERMDRKLLPAASLFLLGNALLLKIFPGGFRFQFGDLLILVATLLWASENVLSKHVLRTIPPRVVALGRMGIGSLIILGVLIATGKITLLGQLTVPHLGWVALTALFPLAYVLTWYAGLREIKVTTATSILLLGSPITTLLVALQSGLLPSFLQVLGMVLIAGGLAVLLRPQRRIRVAPA
uniref:DMT family transporter n=1 Tax=candidate division WWE3 bacterium TaxID=2053526 RepID=A0A831Z2E7_UNCKA